MLIQKAAPEFSTDASMPDDSVKKIKLSDYKGQYVVLYFYPADFTYVCASETIGFHNELAKFTERKCTVLGCSTDTHFVHRAWKNTEKKLVSQG
jgi:peroxiredoxin (alkyl hydroperoxide reductase subunit C)